LIYLGWSLIYRVQKISSVNPRTGKHYTVKHDLFNCFDILATDKEHGTWAVQVTTIGGTTDRRKKVEEVGGWDDRWRISVVANKAEPDPLNKARRLDWWFIWDWCPHTREWTRAIVPFERAKVLEVKLR
jgi:hypothetical protein